MWLASQSLVQLLHEAGFPNARFTIEQHHLAVAVFDLLPAFAQEGDLVRPPDEGCQAPGDYGVKVTLRAIRLDNAIRLGGGCYALQGLLPQGLVHKIALYQPTRDTTDYHSIRHGHTLETGGDVRCFP